MPVSDKQLAANRANAAKSTGPTSIAGKRNSSRNATTHGMLARSVLIEGESLGRFLQLLASLTAEFEATTPSEIALVETMAVARWRVVRSWTLQAVTINHERSRQTQSDAEEDAPTRAMLALRSLNQNSHDLETLSRFESRFDRQYHRAADRLMRLKAEKQQRSPRPLENKGETE